MFKTVKSTLQSRIITVTSLCLVVLLMGIFFAAQSYSTAVAAVTINKNQVEESKWDIGFSKEYYKEQEGSIPSVTHQILPNVATTSVTLNKPHDFIEYVLLVENKGNMDAIISKINVLGINNNVNCTFKVNNEEYKQNVIKGNEKAYITVRVEYKEVVNPLPMKLDLITSIDYKQKEDA